MMTKTTIILNAYVLNGSCDLMRYKSWETDSATQREK